MIVCAHVRGRLCVYMSVLDYVIECSPWPLPLYVCVCQSDSYDSVGINVNGNSCVDNNGICYFARTTNAREFKLSVV